ncbi:hypothetical protein [Novipirellula herctigrandis]|uniref:hypothetical protein n=1 Tax=Novipirellula herctigrandis TaxID=2527986 RepID=UPI003AF40002
MKRRKIRDTVFKTVIEQILYSKNVADVRGSQAWLDTDRPSDHWLLPSRVTSLR